MMTVRNKRLFVFLFSTLLIVSMLLIVPVTQAQDGEPERTGLRPDTPTYGVRGPYAVGFMTFSWEEDGIPVEGGIWYPALKPDGVEEQITYQLVDAEEFPEFPAFINYFDGRAIADAEPDTANGPYPLIVSSTGYGGTPFHLAHQHEHFASHGFVVIAVHHAGNGLRDNLKVQTEEDMQAFALSSFESMVRRPLEVSRAIDYAEYVTNEPGPFAGVIDPARVGVFGISFGGYTGIVIAGASLNLDNAVEFCNENADVSYVAHWICVDQGLSNLPDLVAHLREVAGLDGDADPAGIDLHDPRVGAVVSFSPGTGLSFISEQSLAKVETPVMIMHGTLDAAWLKERPALRVWNNISSLPRSLVTVENGTHTFFLKCGPGLQQAYFDMCVGPVWDKDRIFDMSNHLATAFMMAQLHGDTDAAATLAPDAVQFPGIRYEAVGF